MIRASAGSGWYTAGTPSGWRWRRPRGCCPIWSRCSAGSRATTPARCTRATRSTASCTSTARRRCRTVAVGCCGCARWCTRSDGATRPPGAGLAVHRPAVLSGRAHNERVTLVGPSPPPCSSRGAAGGATRSRQLTGVAVDAEELLAGRAALLGLSPQGRISAGGATRLMRGSDGWCALTLSRPDDVDAVPALVESDDSSGRRSVAGRRALGRTTARPPTSPRAPACSACLSAVLGETPPPRHRVRRLGARAAPRDPAGPAGRRHVVDVGGAAVRTAARRAGATVVKVESAATARRHPRRAAEFFDWMNSGKLSYQSDFDQPSELAAAARRRRRGDRVVAARGAAHDAASARGDIPPRDGRIWLRITGHGTDGERADWVAFGDDAAVSGGLVGGTAEDPVFCGDAIADPLTGLHAALAVVESLRPRRRRNRRAVDGRGGRNVRRSCRAVRNSPAPQCLRPSAPAAANSARTTPPSTGWWPKGGSPHADSAGRAARRHRDRHPRRASGSSRSAAA